MPCLYTLTSLFFLLFFSLSSGLVLILGVNNIVIHLVDGNWENLEVEVGEGEEPIWELEEYLVEMTWYNELLGNENRFSNALQGGTGLEEIMEEGPDL